MHSEALIDRDLQELIGGDSPPDLTAEIEQRIQRRSRLESRSRLSRTLFLRLGIAACAVVAFGLIALVLWPQEPPGVTGSEGAEFTVQADHIQLDSGWLLVESDAPAIQAADYRVVVSGKAVLGQVIPDDEQLNALALQLELNEKEIEMLKKRNHWLVRTGLALCVLAGTATVNGDVIRAGDPEGEPVAEIEEGGGGDEAGRKEAWAYLEAIAEAEDAISEATACSELVEWLNAGEYTAYITDASKKMGRRFNLTPADLKTYAQMEQPVKVNISLPYFPPITPWKEFELKDNENLLLFLEVVPEERNREVLVDADTLIPDVNGTFVLYPSSKPKNSDELEDWLESGEVLNTGWRGEIGEDQFLAFYGGHKSPFSGESEGESTKDADTGKKLARLTDADLKELGDMTALNSIDLSGCEGINDVTDAGLAHLEGLTALIHLDLSHTSRITDAGLAHLTALKALRHLHLDDCELITKQGIETLKKNLPELTVHGS